MVPIKYGIVFHFVELAVKGRILRWIYVLEIENFDQFNNSVYTYTYRNGNVVYKAQRNNIKCKYSYVRYRNGCAYTLKIE